MKPLYCLLLLFFSLSAISKTETDTITNWQLYKDGKLLFKSNGFEKVSVVKIKKYEDFESLELHVFTDAPDRETKRYLQLRLGEKLIYTSIREVRPEALTVLKITKEELLQAVGSDISKTFTVEYKRGSVGDSITVFKLIVE